MQKKLTWFVQLTYSGRSVCILVISGRGTIDTDQTLSMASNMRRRGVQLLVIGVGSAVNGTEASLIAGGDASVVYVDDWAKQASTAILSGRLSDKICSKY